MKIRLVGDQLSWKST